LLQLGLGPENLGPERSIARQTAGPATPSMVMAWSDSKAITAP